jgi:hypothetical protein
MAGNTFKENDVFKGLQNEFGHLNACVGPNGGPYELYDYAKGYFDATKLMLANCKDGRELIDLLVYPICFDFRHAIELFIKYVITDLAKVRGTDHKFKTNHTLHKNWKVAKHLLEEIETSREDLSLFEKVVSCVEEVDPNGQIFRYPENIKGSKHLQEWALVNLALIEAYNEKIASIAHTWHHRIDEKLLGRNSKTS